MKKILLLLFTSIFLAAYTFSKPKSFNVSKKYLIRLYATEYNYTFYTHTPLKDYVDIVHKPFPYKPSFYYKLILLKFPYEGSKYVNRGKQVEWEHIVPAKWMITADPKLKEIWDNGDDKCVTKSGNKYKGRKCLEKVSPQFNKMESDMFNLVPVIGALNVLRNTKDYCVISGEKKDFGNDIDFEVNKTCVEVMPSIRGDVARIVSYMVKTYGIKLDKNETQIIENWKKDYNASKWLIRKKELLEKKFDYNITW
jgi:deoxyribonuclease-1